MLKQQIALSLAVILLNPESNLERTSYLPKGRHHERDDVIRSLARITIPVRISNLCCQRLLKEPSLTLYKRLVLLLRVAKQQYSLSSSLDVLVTL